MLHELGRQATPSDFGQFVGSIPSCGGWLEASVGVEERRPACPFPIIVAGCEGAQIRGRSAKTSPLAGG